MLCIVYIQLCIEQVAAGEMKGKAVLAAMDVNKPENTPISRKFNITGRF